MISRNQLLKELCLSAKELQGYQDKLAIAPRIGGKRNKEWIYSDYDAARIKNLIQVERITHPELSEWLAINKELNLITILTYLAVNSVALSTEELGKLLKLNIAEFQGFQCFIWKNFVFDSIYISDYSQYWEIKVLAVAKQFGTKEVGFIP